MYLRCAMAANKKSELEFRSPRVAARRRVLWLPLVTSLTAVFCANYVSLPPFACEALQLGGLCEPPSTGSHLTQAPGDTHSCGACVVFAFASFALKMSNVEQNCTLLVTAPDRLLLPSTAELQQELESTDVARKVGALKKAIMMHLSGEDAPRSLMTVIRYCITVDDHTLQVRSAGAAPASSSSTHSHTSIHDPQRFLHTPHLLSPIRNCSCCTTRWCASTTRPASCCPR